MAVLVSRVSGDRLHARAYPTGPVLPCGPVAPEHKQLLPLFHDPLKNLHPTYPVAWRNSRRLGYQGLSCRRSGSASPSEPEQHPGGAPSAAALCARAESTHTTRSRLPKTAAVSAKVASRSPRSVTENWSVTWPTCFAPGPFCRPNRRTPAAGPAARTRVSRIERLAVPRAVGVALPGNPNPEASAAKKGDCPPSSRDSPLSFRPSRAGHASVDQPRIGAQRKGRPPARWPESCPGYPASS